MALSKGIKKYKKKKDEDELLTKLHTAETACHVVKYLKRGIWPEQLNREGDAPLHYYIKRRDKHRFDCLMAFLIHSTSIIDLVNNDGMTALHLSCEKNDILSTKALIAFDADLNLINYENCTPLDIVIGSFKSVSDIPQLLIGLGGRHATDIRSLQIQDLEYQENPMASYFTAPEEVSSETVSSEEPNQTIRTRFGLDMQLLSIRSQDDSLSHDSDVMPAVYFSGGLEFHDGRCESQDPEPDPEPISTPLESLAEEEETPPPLQQPPTPKPRTHYPNPTPLTHPTTEEETPPPSLQQPPTPKPRTHYPTPEASIEMAITEASVILAKGKVEDLLTPENSVILRQTNFLNTSPRSVSPVSPIEGSVEAEELPTPTQPTQEELAKAYTEMYSPKINLGLAGTSYQRVTNPMSLEHPDESRDTVPHVTFAPCPERSHSPLSDVIQVNGDHYRQLQKKTIEKLEEAVDSLYSDGNEGYAAWLQWREMVRAKKRKEEIRKELNLGDDYVDFPEPQKPPPKPPTARRENVPQRHKRPAQSRQWHFVRQSSGGGASLSVMKSLRNPRVSVMKSILGSSVAPFMHSKNKGDRVLCLDGGGIKGLIQIEILKHIEALTGKRIVELFDWIVGTSTGAVLALGLVYGGRTLDEMKRMFFELKDNVFKKQSKLIPTACDTDALEELLKKNLGEHIKMRSVTKPKVLVTAVDKRTTKLPLVFFNNCFDDDFTEQHVWKVGRYTSAAPMYFKELDNYVDGGVVANNPCQYALTRIQKFLRDQNSSDVKPPAAKSKKSKTPRLRCVLSIGCGVFPPEPIGNTDILEAMKIHKLHQAPQKLAHLVTLLTSTLSKSEDVAEQCQNSCEEQEIPFYRFNPELGESVKTDETDNEKLCDLIIGAKRLLCDSEDHLSKLSQHLKNED